MKYFHVESLVCPVWRVGPGRELVSLLKTYVMYDGLWTSVGTCLEHEALFVCFLTMSNFIYLLVYINLKCITNQDVWLGLGEGQGLGVSARWI